MGYTVGHLRGERNLQVKSLVEDVHLPSVNLPPSKLRTISWRPFWLRVTLGVCAIGIFAAGSRVERVSAVAAPENGPLKAQIDVAKLGFWTPITYWSHSIPKSYSSACRSVRPAMRIARCMRW